MNESIINDDEGDNKVLNLSFREENLLQKSYQEEEYDFEYIE